MSAPLRIVNPEAPMSRAVRAQPPEGVDSYMDRLTKMIPGPGITLYAVGASQIPGDQVIGLLVGP